MPVTTSKITVLLVDDERLARKRLADLLVKFPMVQIVGEADTVDSAVAKIVELQPDLVFLDIEMPPDNGLDVLKRIPEGVRCPKIVFVTAYDHFAVQAFEVSALDYLMKPVCLERLGMTLERLKSHPAPEASDNKPNDSSWTLKTRVSLSNCQKLRVVDLDQIVMIEALGAYSKVTLRDEPISVVLLRSISEWEERLPSVYFSRIERSIIIQSSLLKKIERESRDKTLVTLDGLAVKLTVGRIAAQRIKSLVE